MTDLIVAPQTAHSQQLSDWCLIASRRRLPVAFTISGSPNSSRGMAANLGPASPRLQSPPGAPRRHAGLAPFPSTCRISAVRNLAVEAADNGLLAPELANGITRVKGVRIGNWLSVKQAQTLLNTPDITTTKGLRDRAIFAVLLGCGLRRPEVAALTVGQSSNGTGAGAS
jgi:site-specific recombinase XerC